ncbi:MAG: tRNA preQ1(34) S-adenosylmethionine ribosyltransferase-isomerase QueA [Bacillota bacterium]|nr:tRNA preQ1(34) S-adenosylmethionine ribosyltransferase-isomerase QueA [Bacillota bacterium]
MDKYSLSYYDYYLPQDLIAQKPLKDRDQSRMLVLNRNNGEIDHSHFKLLPEYLEEDNLLVLNDTRVIPARLNGIIAEKEIAVELLLLHPTKSGKWMAMVKPGRKLKPGVRIELGLGYEAVIEDFGPDGLRIINFPSADPLSVILPKLGKVPLPPYIKAEVDDPEQYQTIYATRDGSAAAPTAGFHFTEEMINTLQFKGVNTAFITLHIGPGTFQPVKTEDIRKHVMHREYYKIDDSTVNIIRTTREKGKRIIAVGTTVCRVLETIAAHSNGNLERSEGWTDLFIYPGFKFQLVDAMLTNFHLPRSTLLMLISAFAGRDHVIRAYEDAVKECYRFFSFGDCMLII